MKSQTKFVFLLRNRIKMEIELKNHIGYDGYPENSVRFFNDDKLINEECHIFDNQYACAEDIADRVFLNAKNKVTNFYVDYDCGDIQRIFVTIVFNNGEDVCHGEISSVIPEKRLIKISVCLNYPLLVERGEQEAKNIIATTVIHELMHGNIFMKRKLSGKDIDDIPENYGKILKNVIRNGQIDSDTYFFARALYLSYYQETQAMVSQGWKEVKNRMEMYGEEYTKENFKWVFRGTPVYYDFSSALNTCRKMLKNQRIKTRVFNCLNENEITFKDNERALNKTYKKLENAMRKLINSCYYYFTKQQQD